THPKNPQYADYWLPELKELVEDYGLDDPIRCLLLFKRAIDHFNEHKRIWDVYRWEQKLMRTAIGMERYGMTYLRHTGRELEKFYREYMKEQKRKLAKLGYGDLNLQS